MSWLVAAFLVVMTSPGDASEATALSAAAREAYRAGRVAKSDGEKRAQYQRSLDLARQALAKDPNDPGGLLWYAGALGSEALTHGKLYALRVVGDIERTLLRLEQIAPEYDEAAAARALGRLYHKAPSIISVGSSTKAADFFGRALARAPDNAGTLAYAADFYEDRGDCSRALALVARLRTRPAWTEPGPDGDEYREIAARVSKSCR
jgi:tetratricopeptide (TPR) repeat protein